MRKKICVVTGTRAEYHLLYPLLVKLKQDEDVELILAVTGAHLCERYGNTYTDIEKDGFLDYRAIPILQAEDTELAVCKAAGIATADFGAYFHKERPDMVVLLGDRYEILAVAMAATLCNIPIAHIHGGEITEGAMDDGFRHAITKLSYLHFTSCEAYRKRVIQMGEAPERVFNAGTLGVENILCQPLLTREELEEGIDFSLGKSYAVVTFHPVTLEKDMAEQEFNELLLALDEFPDMRIIFTKANADNEGTKINAMIDAYVQKHSERAVAFYSLGAKRYLSAIKYTDAVIGNSSSGIIETPSFKTPTVNIGDRQKGRIQAENIINCEPNKDMICNSIKMALSDTFRSTLKDVKSPYGNGNTSGFIVNTIKTFLSKGDSSLRKRFYDI